MTDDKRAYGNNMGKLSDEKLLKIAKEINRLWEALLLNVFMLFG